MACAVSVWRVQAFLLLCLWGKSLYPLHGHHHHDPEVWVCPNCLPERTQGGPWSPVCPNCLPERTQGGPWSPV